MAGEIPASPFVNLSAMIKKRILLLLSSWGLLFSVFAAAQSPTTTYPYLYDRFVDGKVVLDNGETEARSLNVHLRADALHYVDNNVIKQAFLNNVKAVEIGSDVFLPVNGRMLRLAAKNDRGCVAEQIAGDFEAARAGEGAYGLSSTTAATMKLSSIQTDSQINQNYMNILNEKDQGMELPVSQGRSIKEGDWRACPGRQAGRVEVIPQGKQNQVEGAAVTALPHYLYRDTLAIVFHIRYVSVQQKTHLSRSDFNIVLQLLFAAGGCFRR